jgi:DNA integrity scanning protein DisA with diadenylate cyclase activity
MIYSTLDVLSPALSSLLGARRVDLVQGDKSIPSKPYVSKSINLGAENMKFAVFQEGVKLTSLEKELLDHTADAFSVLFNRFQGEGYRAHLRTAISSSVMDIALARFLRRDRKRAFASIQELMQILKKLSYERYEGSPATTGFLVFRTRTESLRAKAKELGFEWLDIGPVEVSGNFFKEPLSYRYIDGNNNYYAANIERSVVATIRHLDFASGDAVDRLSYAQFSKIVDAAGKNAFGALLNNASELEIVLPKRKIIVWRKGAWSVFDPQIFRSFFENQLTDDAVNDLLWTVYSLSKTRHGTIVLLSDMTEKQLKDIKVGSVAGDNLLSIKLIRRLKGRSVTALKSEGTLIRMLSADGLTIIDHHGKIVDTGVITDTSKVANKGTAGGGRTTAAIAASNFGKVIKVSEDGPIELYENGSRKYRFG